MRTRLGDDDIFAVDLLLDRTSMTTDGAHPFVTPVGDSVAARIGTVETILRLIGVMPAADPPADLVQKTMDRIHRQAIVGSQPLEGTQPQLGQGPTQA